MPMGNPKGGGRIRGPTPALDAPWLPRELDAENADQLLMPRLILIPMPMLMAPMLIPDKLGVNAVELDGPAGTPKGFDVVSVDGRVALEAGPSDAKYPKGSSELCVGAPALDEGFSSESGVVI